MRLRLLSEGGSELRAGMLEAVKDVCVGSLSEERGGRQPRPEVCAGLQLTALAGWRVPGAQHRTDAASLWGLAQTGREMGRGQRGSLQKHRLTQPKLPLALSLTWALTGWTVGVIIL